MKPHVISNEKLVGEVRRGMEAADELYILESGIEACSLLCDVYSSDPDHCDVVAGLTPIESQPYRNDIRDFRRQIEKMRKEAIRLQTCGGLVEMVTSKCMMLGFEIVSSQTDAIRASVGRVSLEKQPSEMFISATRRRLRRIISDGEDAMRRLHDQNTKMIFTVVRGVSKGVPEIMEELTSVANRQFVESARRTWDPSRGYRFSTYTWGTMRDKCRQHLSSMSTVRVPNAHIGLSNRLRKGEVDVEAQDVADPKARDKEAANRQNVMNCIKPARSIEQMSEREDTVVPGGEFEDEIVDAVAVKQLLDDLCKILPPAKRDLLLLRVGDVGGDPGVMKEIAIRLHEAGHTKGVVSRQRIQQMMDRLRIDILRYMRAHDGDMLEELGISEEAELAREMAGGRG